MGASAQASVAMIVDAKGQPWQVGNPVPGNAMLKVARIFHIDDTIEVFAWPNEGTEFAKMGQALHFKLLAPLSCAQMVVSSAPYPVWQEMIKEVEALLAEDDLDEDDDEDEDEEPAAAAPTKTNGTAPAPVPQMPTPPGVEPQPAYPALTPPGTGQS